MKMLITGGTGSLGEALVKEFHNDYDITFTYHNNLKKAKIISSDYNAKYLNTNELENLQYEFDIIINNAGIDINPKITEQFSEDDFRKTLDVNVILPFRIIQKNLPYMKKNKYGRIVNITSIYAIKPEVEMSGFNASKSALSTLTKTIAKEYGEFGITANDVLPSTFESKSMQDILKEYVHNEKEKKEYYEMLVENSPIKRLVTTKEIAKLVRYLISDDASFINGASIPIDGGYSI